MFGKVVLLIILVVGAGLYFPSTRPALLDTLGPVINPALGWQSRAEMDQITRKLQMINREGQPIPSKGQDFAEWMVRNFPGGKSRDSWDNEYTIEIWPDSVGIVSKGADLEIRTPDDLIKTVRIQRQRGGR